VLIGAPVGALVGAALGAMSGRWLPISTDVHMKGPALVASRSCGARFELQLGPQGEVSGLGQGGHVSVANACGSRGIVGLEWGAAARATLDDRTTFLDPTYGDIDRRSIRKLHSTFATAFYERPLGRSRFHPHLVGSGGVYSVTRELAEIYQPVSGDYYAVGQKYPQLNVASTRKALGLGIGLKSWIPMGPNFAAGLGARMHMVGVDASRILEAGVNVAYRP
jgi:hypothetical protein